MRRIIRSTLFLAVTAAGPAYGQQFDYNEYESLFGEPVTISATGKPERVADTPVMMDVITAEEIQRSGARDIPTLLSRLPGVDITRPSSGTEEVTLGGYIQPLGSRIMVLLNGRQVYSSAFGEIWWSSLPVELDEIRQIEVIRGPQSALYGFNAVDGVINIVTFDPLDDKVNNVRVRLGNDARRDFSASTTQSWGETAAARVTVADDHAHDRGLVDASPANTAFLKNPSRRAASLDASVDLPDGSRLGLEASHTDITQRSFAFNLFDMRIVTDSVKGGYTADSPIGQIDAVAYYTYQGMPWAETKSFGPFTEGEHTLVGQFSDLFKIGADDSFRLGVDGRRLELAAGNLIGGTLSGDAAAVSGMWDHRFAPWLTMVNALRYDYFKLGRSGGPLPHDIYTNANFDRSIGGLSANSALWARVSADDTLRISFARGLRLPSLTNFGQVSHYVPPVPPVYVYGNPDLDASAVYDYQLGWDHRLAPVDALARVNVFHTLTMSHFGAMPALINGRLVQIESMSTGSVANGILLQLEHKPMKGLRWSANYTFERLHEHYDWGFRDHEPVHKFNLGLGYGLGRWDFDLYGTYTSATKEAAPGVVLANIVGPVKGYGTVTPRIGWHVTDNLTVELVGENLWGYRDSLVQRTGVTYYASMKLTF
jgi:outer membrane receptor for ferrienterochelin and colicins